MQLKYKVVSTKHKGLGIFAEQDIKKDALVIKFDLKDYSPLTEEQCIKKCDEFKSNEERLSFVHFTF